MNTGFGFFILILGITSLIISVRAYRKSRGK